ncbi:MAG: hypothetical protein WKF77_18400 [Planctomycetaceae bacterium]
MTSRFPCHIVRTRIVDFHPNPGADQMLLHGWLNQLRQWTLPSGFLRSHRRGQRLTERVGQPIEGLEARVLLTIDVDQPFSVRGGPIAHVSERFDADASYDLVTLSATGDLTVALNRGDGAWSSIQSMDSAVQRRRACSGTSQLGSVCRSGNSVH